MWGICGERGRDQGQGGGGGKEWMKRGVELWCIVDVCSQASDLEACKSEGHTFHTALQCHPCCKSSQKGSAHADDMICNAFKLQGATFTFAACVMAWILLLWIAISIYLSNWCLA